MITVSVIIPSYNHAQYIKETLYSCLNQDYEGFIEIIIVDDCSTDNTKNELSELDFQNYSNRTVSIIYKENNKGMNDSINTGLSKALGKYVQILASDDVLCVDKIRKQVNFLESYNYDCVYSNGLMYENGNTSKIDLEKFKKMYSLGRGLEFVSIQDWGCPLIQSGLFKLNLLQDLKNIRNEYRSDDWAMIITIFKNYNPGYYDEPLFYYRQHGDNTYSKYWITFPMRIDIVSRLVEDKYRFKALSNIMISQADYLSSNGKKIDSLKFLTSSNIMSYSSIRISARIILKSFLPHRAWLKLLKLKNHQDRSK